LLSASIVPLTGFTPVEHPEGPQFNGARRIDRMIRLFFAFPEERQKPSSLQFSLFTFHCANTVLNTEQEKIYRSMTPEKKILVALSLYHSARQLKAAALRQEYRDWSEARIQEEVREIFLYAGD
jgi:hypothetical protein